MLCYHDAVKELIKQNPAKTPVQAHQTSETSDVMLCYSEMPRKTANRKLSASQIT